AAHEVFHPALKITFSTAFAVCQVGLLFSWAPGLGRDKGRQLSRTSSTGPANGLPTSRISPTAPVARPHPSHQRERYSTPSASIARAHSGIMSETTKRISALIACSASSTRSAIDLLSSGSAGAFQIPVRTARRDFIQRRRSAATDQIGLRDELEP